VQCNWCPRVFKSRTQKWRHNKKCDKKPTKSLLTADTRLGAGGNLRTLLNGIHEKIKGLEESLRALKTECNKIEVVLRLL